MLQWTATISYFSLILLTSVHFLAFQEIRPNQLSCGCEPSRPLWMFEAAAWDNKPFGEQKKDSIRSFWGWHDALWIVEFDDTKMLSSECNVLWTIWHFGIRQQHPRYFSHRSSRSRYTDPNLPGRCLTTPSQGCLRIADVNQDTLVLCPNWAEGIGSVARGGERNLPRVH